MHVFRHIVAVAMLTALPVAASAQTTANDIGLYDRAESHWLASGFVGSSFGADADEASVDFGGTIGYLWNGVFGGEFQTGFAPDFRFDARRSALLGGEEPWVNSYMFNAIGAVPVGLDAQWQPYISGGLGALTLRSNAILNPDGQNEFEPDDSRFAGNIGVGLLGYVGNWGVRGDVRYFHGFEQDGSFDPNTSPNEVIGSQVLSELDFWRANIGLAVRW